MKRDRVLAIARWLYKHLTHLVLENEDQIPAEGPCIIVLNHLSRLDFPAIMAISRYSDVYAVAADTYRTFPIFGKMIDDAGMIWIDRTKADFTAMKRCMTVLKEGKILALAPEGTRAKTKALIEGKEGVVLLASKTRAPLVNMSIFGTEKWMSEILHFRKPRITLRFGPPFELPRIDPDDREASLRAATDETMCHIAAMLPEQYRGHYKDFPRVQELLEEWKARGDLILPE